MVPTTDARSETDLTALGAAVVPRSKAKYPSYYLRAQQHRPRVDRRPAHPALVVLPILSAEPWWHPAEPRRPQHSLERVVLLLVVPVVLLLVVPVLVSRLLAGHRPAAHRPLVRPAARAPTVRRPVAPTVRRPVVPLRHPASVDRPPARAPRPAPCKLPVLPP